MNEVELEMEYPLLDKIKAPGDVKALPDAQLPQLCEEIRGFLIESVSATGGHLSSNLGVVELTVALHRTMQLPRDVLLFDVGHQCYTHKLLTGRREGFTALRKLDGISGFPAPAESGCDAFVAGHGSSALSTAIGSRIASASISNTRWTSTTNMCRTAASTSASGPRTVPYYFNGFAPAFSCAFSTSCLKRPFFFCSCTACLPWSPFTSVI